MLHLSSLDKEKNILKKNDYNYIFSFVNREINILTDTNTEKQAKKDAIINLYEFLVKDEPALQYNVVQEILISFNKSLIKIALFDFIDKCREYSLKILIQ